MIKKVFRAKNSNTNKHLESHRGRSEPAGLCGLRRQEGPLELSRKKATGTYLEGRKGEGMGVPEGGWGMHMSFILRAFIYFKGGNFGGDLRRGSQ